MESLTQDIFLTALMTRTSRTTLKRQKIQSRRTLTDGTEVNYTGNKTKEIDGHLWAEVTHDGKTGWVAADYLKTAKPQESPSNVSQNDSVTSSATPQKPAQSESVDSVAEENKIDINDHAALQEAFNNVRKPGATDDDSGQPGDFDGRSGLQCVDMPKWFLDNFTNLKWAPGDGRLQVENTVSKNNLPKDLITRDYTKVTFPALYSVDANVAELGVVNPSSSGHTGIILDKRIENGKTQFYILHTYNNLKDDALISSLKWYDAPENGASYLNLTNYMK